MYGVFIVVEANFSALKSPVWAAVHDTLGVVDVAVLTDAAWRDWPGGVGDIDHEEATSAGRAAGCPNGVDHIRLLVGDNIVGGAKAGVEGCEVCFDAESRWFINREKLNKVSAALATGLSANVPFAYQTLEAHGLRPRSQCKDSH